MVAKKPNDAKAHRMAATNDLNSMSLPKLAIAKRALKSAFRRQLVTPKTIDVDGIIGQPESFSVYVHGDIKIADDVCDYVLTFRVNERGSIHELDFNGPNFSFEGSASVVARVRNVSGSAKNIEKFGQKIDNAEKDMIAFLARTRELSVRCIILSRLVHAAVADYAKVIPTLKLKAKK